MSVVRRMTENRLGKLITKPGAGHGWAKIQDDMATLADWFDEHLAVHSTMAPQ